MSKDKQVKQDTATVPTVSASSLVPPNRTGAKGKLRGTNVWASLAGCPTCGVAAVSAHASTKRALLLEGSGKASILTHCGICGATNVIPMSGWTVAAMQGWAPDAICVPQPTA